MQLKSLGKARPIILSAGLLVTGTAFPFSYDDYHSNINSVIQNNETARYLNEIESNSYDKLLSKMRFQENLIKWKEETMFLSSANEITQNSHFQDIVEMKAEAVPFILEELEKQPSLLVWALNIIYGRKISNNPNTTIEEACKLWVKAIKA